VLGGSSFIGVALKWQFWEEARGPDALFIKVHEE
jgi:hypothetical protein